MNWRLLAAILVIGSALQSPAQDSKPCIAFVSDSSTGEQQQALEPLRTAVTLSGDFDFYPVYHIGCWTIHVLAIRTSSQGGIQTGYAVSTVVLPPSAYLAGHEMMVAPDTSVFDTTMRDEAAAAIRDIRDTQKWNNFLKDWQKKHPQTTSTPAQAHTDRQ